MTVQQDVDLINVSEHAKDIDLINLSEDNHNTTILKKKVDLTDPLMYQLYTSDTINLTLKDLVSGDQFRYKPPQTREQKKAAQFCQVMEYIDNSNSKLLQLLDSVNATRVHFYNVLSYYEQCR
jgi:hypothetical protein